MEKAVVFTQIPGVPIAPWRLGFEYLMRWRLATLVEFLVEKPSFFDLTGNFLPLFREPN